MGRKRQRPGLEQADNDETEKDVGAEQHSQQQHLRAPLPSTSASASAHDDDDDHEQTGPRKQRRLHTYERARIAFERIQEEKRLQREQREKDKEAREAALQEYESNKKRKEKVMRQRTKRGQPKLGGQIELLLEKIEKTIKKENTAKR